MTRCGYVVTRSFHDYVAKSCWCSSFGCVPCAESRHRRGKDDPKPPQGESLQLVSLEPNVPACKTHDHASDY